jgi:predicted DNA-binding protein
MQEVLSIRIPKHLKEKMRKYKDVDWKRYIIEAIENKIKQLEAEKILKEIEEMNKDLESSKIPAWKIIREDRDASH